MFRQFPCFLVAGTAGFVIDAGILSMLVHIFGYSPYWSRLPSFILAVILTWYVNYHWTFKKYKSRNKLQSFGYYFGVQSTGIVINLIVYITSIYSSDYFFSRPELAIALASLTALFFNYLCMKKWVFVAKK